MDEARGEVSGEIRTTNTHISRVMVGNELLRCFDSGRALTREEIFRQLEGRVMHVLTLRIRHDVYPVSSHTHTQTHRHLFACLFATYKSYTNRSVPI